MRQRLRSQSGWRSIATPHGGNSSGLPYGIPNTGGAFGSKLRGPSLDQLMVNGLNPPTQIASLQLGVSRAVVADEGSTLKSISHENSEQILMPHYSPLEVYNALFENYSPPEDPTRILRHSILDAVGEDLRALKQKIGTEDRQRLDQHLTSIAELRTRITELPPEYQGACMPMASVSQENIAVAGQEPLTEVTAILAELWALAWACDLTRITSLMFSGGRAETVFHPVAGVTKTHAALVQSEDANELALLQPIQAYIMSQAAVLLNKLKETPEGDGNLLDNSLILMTSDCGDAATGSNSEYPLVFVGKCGGAIKNPGVHHRTVGGNANDVLLTALLAMQSGVGTIGAGEFRSDSPVWEILT